MPLGTRNWGGTEYHDSIFDPESQPQEYEQPYVLSMEEISLTFWTGTAVPVGVDILAGNG